MNVHYSFGVNNGQKSGANSFDTQPDVFTARLFGQSYTFILNKKGSGNTISGRVFDNNNIQVSLDLGTMTFTLIDDKGFTYTFNTKDYSTTFSTSENAVSYESSLQYIFSYVGREDETLITNWSLDQVVSPRGRILEFVYDNGLHFTFPKYSFNIEGGDTQSHFATDEGVGTINGANRQNHNASTTIIQNNCLTKIIGDFGTVDFNLDIREDLCTGDALNRISNGSFRSELRLRTSQGNLRYCHGTASCPESLTYLPKMLTSVEVTNSLNKKVVTAHLGHSYFNEDKINDTKKERFLRLKLDGVNINGKEYAFEYRNENALPPKESFAVDFWGYYNGKESNDTYVPRIKRFVTSKFFYGGTNDHLGQTFRTFLGADRSSDHNYGFNGILERITYPTKGFTQLEYEPHDIILAAPAPFTVTERVVNSNRLKWTNMVDESEFHLTYQYLKNAKDGNYDYFHLGSPIMGEPTEQPLPAGTPFTIDFPSEVVASGVLQVPYAIELQEGNNYYIENLDTGRIFPLLKSSEWPTSSNQPKTVSKSVFLGPGNYTLRCCNTGLPLIFSGDITLFTYENDNVNLGDFFERFEVGGARVAKIVHRDANGAFIRGVRYEYTYPNGIAGLDSSGKLMDDLIFHTDVAGFHSYNPGAYPSFLLVGHNAVGGNLSAQGSHIGYSHVKELAIDVHGNSEGWLEREFHNEKNAYFQESFCRPFSYDGRVGDGNPTIEIFGLITTNWFCSGLDFGNDCAGTIRAYSILGDACIENTTVLGVPLRLDYSYANGNILKESSYDKEGNLVQRTENVYQDLNGNVPAEYFSSFMNIPLPAATDANGAIQSSILLTMEGPWAADHHTYFPYRFPSHYGRVSKISETTTTNYLEDREYVVKNTTVYDQSTHHTEMTIESVNQQEPYTNQYFYPYDDEVSTKNAIQDLTAENRLSTVVKSIRSKGNKEVQVLDYDYGNSTETANLTLVTSVSTSKSQEGLEIRAAYQKYDPKGNLLQSQRDDGVLNASLWAYNGQFRVIVAENVSYDDLEVHASQSLPQGYGSLNDFLESLSEIQTSTTQKDNLALFNNTLRDALPNAMITSYTYDPLIGVTSNTDPRGYTTYYIYDDENRLKEIRDAGNRLLSDYQYNYRQ